MLLDVPLSVPNSPTLPDPISAMLTVAVMGLLLPDCSVMLRLCVIVLGGGMLPPGPLVLESCAAGEAVGLLAIRGMRVAGMLLSFPFRESDEDDDTCRTDGLPKIDGRSLRMTFVPFTVDPLRLEDIEPRLLRDPSTEVLGLSACLAGAGMNGGSPDMDSVLPRFLPFQPDLFSCLVSIASTGAVLGASLVIVGPVD